jgi:DNA-directed RNA polymerase specialized sigma24 family protein
VSAPDYDSLRSTLRAVMAHIDALPATEAVQAAAELVEAVQAIERRANLFRAETVARMADDEGLSVVEVAARLGVTKQRASVILRTGRNANGD